MNFDTLLSRLSFFRYGPRLEPVRDWFMLLGVLGALVSVSVLWNIWLFVGVAEGDTIGNAPYEAPSLSGASADAVRRIFDVRSEEQKRYENEYRFVDPSRPGG